MKALVFSTVFPNAAQPMHGLFVFERARHMRAHAELTVIAPVSWLVRLRHRVPYREIRGGLTVLHPTFFYTPGIFKALDGFCLFLSSLWTVWRVRREFPFELIDAHFAYPDGFAAVSLGRVFKCPVTVTLRGTLMELSRYRLRRRAIVHTLQRATRLVSVSRSLADCAIALGADATRLDVIPNGVDIERFFPMPRAEARRALGLQHRGRLLVSVGHLCPRKGFDRVLRVLRDVVAEAPDVMFAIVGGAGVERDNVAELQRIVHAESLDAHVVFAGPQPPAMVALWLNAADVFVLASDHEGCPNVVWEALACGRPVVATAVGETARMVPAFGGIVFDNAHDLAALKRCLLEALATEWNSDTIRSYAATHTWPGVAARVFNQWCQG